MATIKRTLMSVKVEKLVAEEGEEAGVHKYTTEIIDVVWYDYCIPVPS